jgi:mono/diheme cytochrome c family protein
MRRIRTIFAVLLVGGAAACSRKESVAPTPPPADAATKTNVGEEVYDTYCSVCHMPDGTGVPNFQPALAGSPIVSGDAAKLEAVVRAGSAALRDRPSTVQAEMPPFGTLSDEEVKGVVEYVRARFGSHPSTPATP